MKIQVSLTTDYGTYQTEVSLSDGLWPSDSYYFRSVRTALFDPLEKIAEQDFDRFYVVDEEEKTDEQG